MSAFRERLSILGMVATILTTLGFTLVARQFASFIAVLIGLVVLGLLACSLFGRGDASVEPLVLMAISGILTALLPIFDPWSLLIAALAVGYIWGTFVGFKLDKLNVERARKASLLKKDEEQPS